MTVVIGRRFGDTIVVLSDTMISDANTGRNSAIPGRLKAIVVADRLSIAYAGHSDPALHAIRRTPDIYMKNGLPAVLEALRQFTACRDHDVDFIVASHDTAAELRRVWDGQVSNPLQETCIGNCSIVQELRRRFSPTGEAKTDAKNFRVAFLNVFSNRRVFAGSGVGGFPIALEARTDGHIYKGHTLNASWKPSKFVPGATIYEDENDLLTGEWSFRHDILTVKQPGLAVLAAEVPQAKIGFVYAPMLQNDPDPVRLLDIDEKWTQKQSEMHAVMRAALDASASSGIADRRTVRSRQARLNVCFWQHTASVVSCRLSASCGCGKPAHGV